MGGRWRYKFTVSLYSTYTKLVQYKDTEIMGGRRRSKHMISLKYTSL